MYIEILNQTSLLREVFVCSSETVLNPVAEFHQKISIKSFTQTSHVSEESLLEEKIQKREEKMVFAA